jgi:hypothetical protein
MTSPRHLGVARALSTLLAIALGLSACGAPAASNEPQAPADRSDVNVVALFDRSGSTSTNSSRGGNGSRVGIERAIWPAVFFPNLGKTYSLNVLPVGFDSTAVAWCKWPDRSKENQQGLSQTAECEDSLKKKVASAVSGNTDFNAALTLANDLLGQKGGTKIVLLVSDGEYNIENVDINCAKEEERKECRALKESINLLNAQTATICPIFVKTKSAKPASATLQWIRDLQAQNDDKNKLWAQQSCPVINEINLSEDPWQLAQVLINWYGSDLAQLLVRQATVDASGQTQNPMVVPNGAAQIAMIGLKRSQNSTVTFSAGGCALGASATFPSFTYMSVNEKPVDGGRCAGGSLTGKGLVAAENSFYALFVPETLSLIACAPNSDGGGIFTLSPGFSELLAFNPKVFWVGPKGEKEDAGLKPEQLLTSENGIALSEGQAEKLDSLGDDWLIALDFSESLNKPAGNDESYSLLYQSVHLREGDASAYAARKPISPTLNSVPCVEGFVRSPLQKFWLALVMLFAFVALLIAKRLIDSQRIDLAGDLAILDGTGSRSVASSSISGGSPSWFNVGDRGKIEPGKGEDGKNWRLRWRGGTNVSLEPADGEVGDWSEGTVKSERGRGFIEFKRVPLVGGSETNTIRYTPEEGTKMGELINRELEDPE